MIDGGPKRETCCRSATPEEIETQPELFDCTTCGVARLESLWPENAEAWQCYQTLCGRTVSLCEMRGWAFAAMTDGWSWRERTDLLDRLDVILAMVQPESTPDGGSDQT